MRDRLHSCRRRLLSLELTVFPPLPFVTIGTVTPALLIARFPGLWPSWLSSRPPLLFAAHRLGDLPVSRPGLCPAHSTFCCPQVATLSVPSESGAPQAPLSIVGSGAAVSAAAGGRCLLRPETSSTWRNISDVNTRFPFSLVPWFLQLRCQVPAPVDPKQAQRAALERPSLTS